jgi:type II secretory pathway component GspD/PulD (secretin)
MRISTWLALAGVAALAACGGPRLDTRTFQLKNLRGDEAMRLLGPYVFRDRKEAPGAMSETGSAITVRETPDNLDKIARVLAQFDQPKPSVRLTFQIIQADGAATTDPAISEVEGSLRKLFRFKGYRLLAEAVVGGMEGSGVTQVVSGPGGPYAIDVGILSARGSGDSGSVRIQTTLRAQMQYAGPVLNTAVTLRPGQTAVLGNAQVSPKAGTGTLILTVRPELVP